MHVLWMQINIFKMLFFQCVLIMIPIMRSNCLYLECQNLSCLGQYAPKEKRWMFPQHCKKYTPKIRLKITIIFTFIANSLHAYVSVMTVILIFFNKTWSGSDVSLVFFRLLLIVVLPNILNQFNFLLTKINAWVIFLSFIILFCPEHFQEQWNVNDTSHYSHICVVM